MSVLINGMELPKSCVYCDLRNIECDECGVTHFNLITECSEDIDNDYIRYLPLDWKSKHCPLIEVPKHGRLIDADALKKRVQKLQEWLWDKLTDADVGIVTADDLRYRIAEESEEFIDDAPTIIEREDE